MSQRAPIRVFQFATGNVGSEMIGRIVHHPDLELVGLYCYTPEKVGRDAGEIVGGEPLGVKATDRLEDVLAAEPDVVNFNGVWPDVDLFCTLLEHGINVVTTSDWITGHHRNQNHPHPSGRKPTELIDAACRKGGATFYGTGMNPGLAQILSVVATAGMGRVDHVTRARERRRLLPPLGGYLEERGLRAPGRRPGRARPAGEGLHGLRRRDPPDGRLPRRGDRRRGLRV